MVYLAMRAKLSIRERERGTREGNGVRDSERRASLSVEGRAFVRVYVGCRRKERGTSLVYREKNILSARLCNCKCRQSIIAENHYGGQQQSVANARSAMCMRKYYGEH